MRWPTKNRGFTLIEVLITIAILGTMTLLVAQSIQNGTRNKAKIQEQVDDQSKVRNALLILQIDINKAFHYQDVEKEFADALKKKSQAATPATPKPGQPGVPAPVAAATTTAEKPRELPRIDPLTNFIGKEEQLDFVTKNAQRTIKDSRVADFQEVGYQLKDCRTVQGDSAAAKCLWRRTSPYVDHDVTKGGEEMVLLDHVTEFKLRYFGKGKQDWVKEWSSSASGDAITTGNFPLAVEVSLTYEREVNGKKKKKYKMQIVVPLRFPNNKEKSTTPIGTGQPGKDASTPAPGTTPTPSPGG